MSGDILGLLARCMWAVSLAIALVFLLRTPVRRAFGARAAYTLWLFAPIAILANFLPARRILVTVLSPTQAQPQDLLFTDNFATYLLAIWVVGVAINFTVLARSHWGFLARLDLRKATGEGAYYFANTDSIGPAVVGVLRPRIVVPADFLQRYTELEGKLVIEHERAHLVGRDPQFNALAALIQCLVWFNPLVYLGRIYMRIDQELACDERVMDRHAGARRSYAEAMLKTQMATLADPLSCHLGPRGANALKRRIAMLNSPRASLSQRRLGLRLCAAMIFATGVSAWAAQPAQAVMAADFVIGQSNGKISIRVESGPEEIAGRKIRDAARGARRRGRTARTIARLERVVGQIADRTWQPEHAEHDQAD